MRTDPATGAQTALVTFALRTRRELMPVEEALRRAEILGAAAAFAVNEKSGRAALVEVGLTTAGDDDRLAPAVRLLRPEKRSLLPLKAYEESAWTAVDVEAWRGAWAAEIAEADPWRTRELTLATGLLLPVWAHLPAKGAQVRRVKAPDGRRWLGRVLDPQQARQLKVALGLTDLAAAWGDGRTAGEAVLQQGVQLGLAGGLWLRRARLMDRWRLEVVGAAPQRAAFAALGCFTEIVAYTPRVFVPVDQAGVLEAVLRRHPVEQVLEPGR